MAGTPVTYTRATRLKTFRSHPVHPLLCQKKLRIYQKYIRGNFVAGPFHWFELINSAYKTAEVMYRTFVGVESGRKMHPMDFSTDMSVIYRTRFSVKTRL